MKVSLVVAVTWRISRDCLWTITSLIKCPWSSVTPLQLNIKNSLHSTFDMFSYIVGGFAILIILANPISQFFYPQSQHSRDWTRPQLNESLLAINAPNDTVPDCAATSFTAHILKSQPLVVYLEKFLSGTDREELLRLR